MRIAPSYLNLWGRLANGPQRGRLWAAKLRCAGPAALIVEWSTSRYALKRGVSPIDGDDGSGHVAGSLLGSQEDRQGSQFARLSQSLHRDRRFPYVFNSGVFVQIGARHFGFHI